MTKITYEFINAPLKSVHGVENGIEIVFRSTSLDCDVCLIVNHEQARRIVACLEDLTSFTR